jgi:phosphopantothenoylcysteine decarboxylase/phosphopantothenate--cysteine ligase
MGFALAEECASRGADVLLISGPVKLETGHPNIKRINVESAEEMHQAATAYFPETDIAILCAAVADYKSAHYSENKLKRQTGELFRLELTPNPDIAAALGKMKKENQVVVGFALETENEWANANEKLQKKNLDFIVLNSLKDAGAGFQGNTNKITIINAQGHSTAFPLKSKKEVAGDIINEIIKEENGRSTDKK